MSRDAVAAVSAEPGMFRPRVRFHELAQDHVKFDDLTQSARYEARALSALSREPICLFVTGISGAGKSSFVAHIANHLPHSHVALRIPILALDDPLDRAQVMSITLAEALRVIELDADAQEELEESRADSKVASRAPAGVTGGKLGGAMIPVAVNVEVGSLRQEFTQDTLVGDRLEAVGRLVAILREGGVIPVFVMEDTEAAVGADRPAGDIERFLDGPVRAFVQEIDAPCVIAVQSHLVRDSDMFARLAATQTEIVLPSFADRAVDAIAAVLAHRLAQYDVGVAVQDVVAPDALDGLGLAYAYAEGNLRHVLAIAHDATVRAAEMGSELVRIAHVTQAAADFGLRA